jgi:hypothetical protein
MHDDELTPEERERFRALRRELDPDDALEERTVRALRAEGLLRRERPHLVAFPLSPAWVGLAAAAAFAIFAGGFTMGSWLEARHTTQVVSQMHEQDATRAAAWVQQTGSAYVSALAALAAMTDSSSKSNPQLEQGREVAVNALHAAANQLVRIAPEDPLTVRILAGMKRAARDSTGTDRLVWF